MSKESYEDWKYHNKPDLALKFVAEECEEEFERFCKQEYKEVA